MNSASLSPLEAGFLYAESPFTPMHIGSLSIYDGTGWRGPDGQLLLETLRAHVDAKLSAVPRLRQYPVWPLGRAARPRWVDDRSFEITRHVMMVSLPAPGTEAQLLALVEDLNMTTLDRSHPLWELWFIDGLDGGRVALLEKIHHSLVDGIGGVDLAMMLLDSEPTVAPMDGEAEANGARSAPGGSLLDRFSPAVWAAQAAIELPANIGRDLAVLATHPLRSLRSGLELSGAARHVAANLVAPRSSLNQQIGGSRRYRVIRRSLEEIRQTAHTWDGTVNDIVLAAVSAGLHDIVASRSEDLHNADLHALVPVSMRSDGDHGEMGNRVSALIVHLPTSDMDPAERLATVHAAVRDARDHHEVELSHALLTVMQVWPEPVVASVASLAHHQPLFNLVVTNVPGPPVPLYLMGSEMLEAFPLVPLAGNLTVSVGILSYHRHLTLGLWADKDRFPDLNLLVDGIEAAFGAMAAAAAEVLR